MSETPAKTPPARVPIPFPSPPLISHAREIQAGAGELRTDSSSRFIVDVYSMPEAEREQVTAYLTEVMHEDELAQAQQHRGGVRPLVPVAPCVGLPGARECPGGNTIDVKGPTMSMLDSVAVLIDCAKRLRGVAQALDAGDLKAQIVDELLRLHETRESLLLVSGDGRAPKSDAAVGRIPAEPAKLLVDGDSKIFTFDADEVTETYDLHLDAAEPAAAAAASNGAATGNGTPGGNTAPAPPGDGSPAETAATAQAAAPATAAHGAQASGSNASAAQSAATTETAERSSSGAASTLDMPDEVRFALAEQRIMELEPLHQAVLRKMNDLLTDEQRRTKAAATRAGIKAGKKGRELQQSVMAALHLTPDQQQRMAAARKELLDVRQAIARQVEGLLSKEQLDRMLQQFAKKHGG